MLFLADFSGEQQREQGGLQQFPAPRQPPGTDDGLRLLWADDHAPLLPLRLLLPSSAVRQLGDVRLVLTPLFHSNKIGPRTAEHYMQCTARGLRPCVCV